MSLNLQLGDHWHTKGNGIVRVAGVEHMGFWVVKKDGKTNHGYVVNALGQFVDADSFGESALDLTTRHADLAPGCIVGPSGHPGPITMAESKHHSAAVKTLLQMGYTYHDGEMWKPPIGQEPAYTAPEILTAAVNHMNARVAMYDAPDGERSMGRTVDAFNIISGRDGTDRELTESEGWLFMQTLKDVRDRQRATPHRDSLEDGVAYASLKAEARLREADGV